jgi:DNA-binding response OmpR family regulator
MLKVLVVDDDQDILNIITLFLADNGYDFVTAMDGAEGISRFNESFFDIVITDFFMPKCNGDELARHVHNSGRNIPVIGITGASWDMDQSWFDMFIYKPFAFEELDKCITVVLNLEKLKK